MANLPGVVFDGNVRITDPTALAFIQTELQSEGLTYSTNAVGDFITRFLVERAQDLSGQSAANQVTARNKRKTLQQRAI